MRSIGITMFLLLAGSFGVRLGLAYEPSRETFPTSANCDAPVTTAFVPSLDYTIYFSAAQASTSTSSCTAGLSLIYPVNGDTEPSLACSLSDVNGYAVISSQTPIVKIGGMQCDGRDRSTLEVNNIGSDNPNVDIAITTQSTSEWSDALKVDNATPSNKRMLFGTGGQVYSSPIIDGSDYDGYTNGEVAFGGTTITQGASKIFVKVKYVGHAIDPASDRETLTFTFTPSQ